MLLLAGYGGSPAATKLGSATTRPAEAPTGIALLLKVAQMHQADGVCVVAFGAEKLGLFGSQAFVATHDVSGTRLMLNFDIAGHLDGPSIVGNAGLTLETLNALAVAEELQIVAEVFQPFAFSDHVSFSEVGVPSVTITNGDDPAIHTSEDALVRISVGALETILGIVDVVLEPVAAGNQS